MDERGQELRETIARLGRQRRNDAIPESLRGEAMEYAAERRKQGASWQSIGQELGLSASCLQRWSALAIGETRMLRVRVRRELRESASTPQGTGEAIVLVSPRGFRLEGLGLPQVLELLQALG